MTPPADTVRYKNHRFPGEIISHGVWLYYRFTLRYRDVQELLFERGITVSHEAVRQWQTASKSYLQKWGVKATLLDRLTPSRSIPRFLWHESFILLLRRMVALQNALQRVRSA